MKKYITLLCLLPTLSTQTFAKDKLISFYAGASAGLIAAGGTSFEGTTELDESWSFPSITTSLHIGMQKCLSNMVINNQLEFGKYFASIDDVNFNSTAFGLHSWVGLQLKNDITPYFGGGFTLQKQYLSGDGIDISTNYAFVPHIALGAEFASSSQSNWKKHVELRYSFGNFELASRGYTATQLSLQTGLSYHF